MIEDIRIAEQILKKVLDIHDRLEEVIISAEPNVQPDELKWLKRGIGYVLYESFEKIVEPICKKYPSLKPPQMES